MWLIFAIVSFAAWGTADLFYKKSADENERYSHLKTAIMVGLIMGIVAIGMLIIEKVDYDPINLITYFPVSFMYILSMTVGYFGLKYLEVSISSPIQNASGAFSSIIMMIVLRKLPNYMEGIAVILITFGVIMLGFYEKKKESIEESKSNKKNKIGFVAFMMPIFYCIIDSLGTALDGIYLDDIETTPLRNVTPDSIENVANISYMLTFLIVAIILFIYVYGIKREPIRIYKQKDRALAGVCETVGQLTYIHAISANGLVAAPLIASYCVFSVLLARVILKEKLEIKQYIMIAFVFAGILLLGILEGL